MHRILWAILLFISLKGIAQPNGNEWIDYSKAYYPIKVHQTGLHFVTHAALQSAGVPLTGVLPDDFQIFGKQRELLIHVEDHGDGTFDSGDYIAFYGERNDGWLDSLLYQNPTDIGNPAYSMTNDTLTYYLTINQGGANTRMAFSTDINYALHTSVPWVWHRVLQYYADGYLQGFKVSGLSSSRYTQGEGWFGGGRNAYDPNPANTYIDSYINTPFSYSSGGPDAEVYAISASYSDADAGNPNHHLNLQYYNGSSWITAHDLIFSGYQINKLDFTIPNSQIQSAAQIRHQLVGDLGVATDYQAVSYVSVEYPRVPTLSGAATFEFELEPSGTGVSRVSFSGFSGTNPWLLLLEDSLRRVPMVNNSGVWEALIPNHPFGTRQRCFLSDSTAGYVDTLLTGRLFVDYSIQQPDSAFVIITHPSLFSGAGSYAAYRSSAAGGNRDVVVVNVEQLYHQYGGGIYKHPLAIRRFMNHMLQAWTSAPSELFLMGKSIQESSPDAPGTRKYPLNFAKNLVPTIGFPPSDNLFTAGLNGTTYQPAVPTGRLAAKNNNEVLHYLNKVIEYESHAANPVYTSVNKEWMKQFLHFSGGANAAEQTLFKYYLGTFATTAEDTLFGANTELLAKASSDPIDPVEFNLVKDKLENGVALMTFFGHAALNGFDQNLDDPINWNNQGKYPFLIGNSCYTGDIHIHDATSTSENFVLIPDRGVIGFLASNKVGFSNGLYAYTSELYKQFCRKNYGKPMSHCIQAAIAELQSVAVNLAFTHTTTMEMMTLHGDPSIVLYSHALPEYEITAQSVIIEPSGITLAIDTLDLGVVITNLGKAVNKPFQLEVLRRYPDGVTIDTFRLVVPHVFYKDTIWVRVPVNHGQAAGINQFEISIDIPSFVTELYDESGNNRVIYDLPMFFDGILPVWPYEYAIVPSDSIVLKGSTVNPFALMKNYRFEIDTVDFNEPASPFRRYQIIASEGGVVEAHPADWLLESTGAGAPLILSDSTVYFWRVAMDTVVPVWTEYSFQYILGKRGWGQAHYFQFKKNRYNSLVYHRPQRRWNFGDSFKKLYVQTFDEPNTGWEYNWTYFTLDGDIVDYGVCWGGVNAIHVMVINALTLEVWKSNFNGLNPQWDFGNDLQCANSRGRPEAIFRFRQDVPAQLDSLEDMLLNDIPCNHIVIVHTVGVADYSEWVANNPTLDDAFQTLGFPMINTANPERAFLIGYRTCDTTFKFENYAVNQNDTLQILEYFETSTYEGFMTGETAGPARYWNALYWKQHADENPTKDSSRIQLIGIEVDGSKTVLVDTLLTAYDSLLDLTVNYGLDASLYPYAELKLYTKDDSLLTPAQMERWQLIYTPVPEAALNAKKGYYFSVTGDTISEGGNVKFAIAIENISDMDMDSLLVHYWVEDEQRVRNYISYARQDSLRVNEYFLDTLEFNTAGFPGLNSFWIEANPYVNGIKDQPEQYHFNNLAQHTFYTRPDNVNPILDVSFDGIHILDGEIVSAKPLILITLKDENPMMIMDSPSDTSFFSVWLTDPLGTQTRVYFNMGGQEIMRFYPAVSVSDKFKIEYQGNFPIDGKYQLFVQASDRSGNKSGDNDLKINFEVVNKTTITEVLNYPNPFSTSTRFVFTLTGSVVPDYFEIQIYTISGKLVRNIRNDELGPIRIGRNITEFAWDGTDTYGDRLANGVYLYRVITRLNEQDVEYRATEAAEYFTKGIGKMYLMR
jgi:hypothetical protein